MEIKTVDEIEGYIKDFVVGKKDNFLIDNIYKIKANWKIVLTEDKNITKTACISMPKENTGHYTMYFNKDFIMKNIENKEWLVFVFLHELMHKVNGDLFREDSRNYGFLLRNNYNLVFDIKINTGIIKDYLKEGWHFLKNFYKDTGMVVNFILNPAFDFNDIPDIYNNGEKQAEIMKSIEKIKFKDERWINDKPGLARWYIDAWFKDVSVAMLYERLEKIINPQYLSTFVDTLILLGHHGFSKGTLLSEIKFIEKEEEIEKDNSRIILEAVRHALEDEGDNKIMDKVITSQRGIIPAAGRRELMLLYKKKYPFFFPNAMEEIAAAYRNVNLYIDVSGSVDYDLPFIYKLVDSVKSYLNDPIYLLSNGVEEVSLAELRNGLVITSHSTDFDEVLKHALNNNFKKLLVVTDGDGRIDRGYIKEVKEKKIEGYLVLTDEINEYANAWEEVAKKVWILRSNK